MKLPDLFGPVLAWVAYGESRAEEAEKATRRLQNHRDGDRSVYGMGSPHSYFSDLVYATL